MALFSCRGAGDTGVTVHAADVRDALEPDYMNAVIDIWQVLGTLIFQSAAGVDLVARRGPSQCLNSVFEFTLVGGRGIGARTPEAFPPLQGAPEDSRRAGREDAGQGNRILLGEDSKQVIMVPSSLLALGLDADFDVLFLFEQVQGQVSGYRQIAVGVARPDPAPVLIESHVQDPVQAVFDPPVLPGCFQERRRRGPDGCRCSSSGAPPAARSPGIADS